MKKILVVEDEPGHLKTITEYLSSANQNYEIISAGNGHIACKIAETEIPDLIIMDWELPVLNGIEATVKMKQNPVTHSIPIIMCTGVMINSQDLQTAFIAGAIDYIRKPVDKIELIARVRSMLMLADYFSQKNIAENKIIDLKREIQEQEINRLQTELDFKNKELTSKAMFLIQKDEILITLKEKLIEFSKSVNKELSSKISDLIKDLNLQQNDNRWKEFEVHFENVHEEFYNRLKLKNPDLTANDKKLCAFIRLNMSTKEICALTHQSVKSIEVARTRLRQKLNLSRDESLNTFISLI